MVASGKEYDITLLEVFRKAINKDDNNFARTPSCSKKKDSHLYFYAVIKAQVT